MEIWRGIGVVLHDTVGIIGNHPSQSQLWAHPNQEWKIMSNHLLWSFYIVVWIARHCKTQSFINSINQLIKPQKSLEKSQSTSPQELREVLISWWTKWGLDSQFAASLTCNAFTWQQTSSEERILSCPASAWLSWPDSYGQLIGLLG